MLNIAIDSIEIDRFYNFENYSINILKKIFTLNEISYCLEIKSKTKERFAARFCSKEAAYKAINIFLEKNISLIEFFKYIEITKESSGNPLINIDFNKLKLKKDVTINKILLSITHTKSTATAIVAIF